MTVEYRRFVRMPGASASVVLSLHRRALAALERAAKAPVGDRTDILRFERAQTEIELLAVIAANSGAPTVQDESRIAERRGMCVVGSEPPGDVSESIAGQVRAWQADGALVVEFVAPLGYGETVHPAGRGDIRPVAEVWESPSGSRGKEAVLERFLAQLEAAVVNPLAPGPISPSGVSNSVLTEGLRTFVTRAHGAPEVTAPVTYRDGSSARPFRLRALDLVDDREPVGAVYAFSLLSIRHVALDATVDGAWLRNTDVSRPRPAADTDELVYRDSMEQLARLCEQGPTTIVMYQTGLDTAIVGFYRAVTDQLSARPGQLLVLPRYYQLDGGYLEGTAWRVP